MTITTTLIKINYTRLLATLTVYLLLLLPLSAIAQMKLVEASGPLGNAAPTKFKIFGLASHIDGGLVTISQEWRCPHYTTYYNSNWEKVWEQPMGLYSSIHDVAIRRDSVISLQSIFSQTLRTGVFTILKRSLNGDGSEVDTLSFSDFAGNATAGIIQENGYTLLYKNFSSQIYTLVKLDREGNKVTEIDIVTPPFPSNYPGGYLTLRIINEHAVVAFGGGYVIYDKDDLELLENVSWPSDDWTFNNNFSLPKGPEQRNTIFRLRDLRFEKKDQFTVIKQDPDALELYDLPIDSTIVLSSWSALGTDSIFAIGIDTLRNQNVCVFIDTAFTGSRGFDIDSFPLRYPLTNAISDLAGIPIAMRPSDLGSQYSLSFDRLSSSPARIDFKALNTEYNNVASSELLPDGRALLLDKENPTIRVVNANGVVEHWADIPNVNNRYFGYQLIRLDREGNRIAVIYQDSFVTKSSVFNKDKTFERTDVIGNSQIISLQQNYASPSSGCAILVGRRSTPSHGAHLITLDSLGRLVDSLDLSDLTIPDTTGIVSTTILPDFAISPSGEIALLFSAHRDNQTQLGIYDRNGSLLYYQVYDKHIDGTLRHIDYNDENTIAAIFSDTMQRIQLLNLSNNQISSSSSYPLINSFSNRSAISNLDGEIHAINREDDQLQYTTFDSNLNFTDNSNYNTINGDLYSITPSTFRVSETGPTLIVIGEKDILYTLVRSDATNAIIESGESHTPANFKASILQGSQLQVTSTEAWPLGQPLQIISTHGQIVGQVKLTPRGYNLSGEHLSTATWPAHVTTGIYSLYSRENGAVLIFAP